VTYDNRGGGDRRVYVVVDAEVDWGPFYRPSYGPYLIAANLN
jgi:hypothetical protein